MSATNMLLGLLFLLSVTSSMTLSSSSRHNGVAGSIRVDGRISPLRNRLNSSSSSSSSSFSTKLNTSSTIIQEDEENQALLLSPTHNNKSQQSWNDRGVTWALYISYLTLMGSKISLPSTLSMLTAPASTSGLSLPLKSVSTTPSQFMAHVLSLSTLSLALGKAITGPIIDLLGGVRSLQVALSLLALMLFNISFTTSFRVFQYSWMMVDFIFASGWAACLNAISHTTITSSSSNTPDVGTDKENTAWTSKIRGLATSARIGNALFFTIFGSLLQWTPQLIPKSLWIQKWIPHQGQAWRMVYLVSGLVQSIPLTLLFLFGHGKHVSKKEISTHTSLHSRTQASPLQCLQKEVLTWTFWCQLINRSVLILIASFLLFVPSYMSSCFHMSMSSAARVGSVYALGCLLALSPKVNQGMGRVLSSKLSLNPKSTNIAMMNIFLGSLLGCCLLQLGHLSKLLPIPTSIGVLSMFLWGFSFAIPFYIPSSVYALKRGGTTASATIADAFDFSGFLFLAWFNGYVAGLPLSNPTSWIGPFQILTACTLISMASLSTALYLEKDT